MRSACAVRSNKKTCPPVLPSGIAAAATMAALPTGGVCGIEILQVRQYHCTVFVQTADYSGICICEVDCHCATLSICCMQDVCDTEN